MIDLDGVNRGDEDGGNMITSGMDMLTLNHNDKDKNKDTDLIDGLRRRMQKLNDTIFELKKNVQKLDLENNGKASFLSTKRTL